MFATTADTNSGVDLDQAYADTHQILLEADDRPMAVLMNKTDISKNNNKFYRIQLAQHLGSDELVLLCKWGRVGAPRPRTSVKPYSSKKSAVSAFKKKYREKTGNTWGEPFRDQGKYTPIDVLRASDGEGSELDVPEEEESEEEEEVTDSVALFLVDSRFFFPVSTESLPARSCAAGFHQTHLFQRTSS